VLVGVGEFAETVYGDFEQGPEAGVVGGGQDDFSAGNEDPADFGEQVVYNALFEVFDQFDYRDDVEGVVFEGQGAGGYALKSMAISLVPLRCVVDLSLGDVGADGLFPLIQRTDECSCTAGDVEMLGKSFGHGVADVAEFQMMPFALGAGCAVKHLVIVSGADGIVVIFGRLL